MIQQAIEILINQKQLSLAEKDGRRYFRKMEML